ncbi:MAG: DUF3429 domain-containing protein [Rhodobacterales bacterium]|nr:DUF3429 domain-containing protein [Rhodobacterales bacterium]
MYRIPIAPLILGLSGLIPFFWGTLTLYQPGLSDLGNAWLGSRFIGPYVQLFYGTLILAFMSGVLWGFATKADPKDAPLCYVLSVLPVLWVFLTTGDGLAETAISLMAGFGALLLIDLHFWRRGLTPEWWMSLRLLLSTVVVLCLLPLAL